MPTFAKHPEIGTDHEVSNQGVENLAAHDLSLLRNNLIIYFLNVTYIDV